MSEKKNILIFCPNDYQKQPRVLRTIEALEKNYAISVAGFSEAKTHSVNFIQLNPVEQTKASNWHFDKPFFIKLPVSFWKKYIVQKQYAKTSYYEKRYWTDSRKQDLKNLSSKKFDLIICHGTDDLPLVIKLSQGKTPVIFNAHEYYPLEFEQDENWLNDEGAFITYIINAYLPKCSHMFCVNNSIQKEYLETIEISSTIINNAPKYLDLKPQSVNPNKIRIIHHGIALRERNIEEMASLINFLDKRFELTIMLTVYDQKYYDELKQLFSSNSRISFIPAKPLEELCPFLNGFDIGYYILPPVNFNTKYALPNKLFEYVQARLCLAFGPSPEMKNIIEKYNLGVVTEDFSPQSIAEKLNALSHEEIHNFKLNSHKHAKELSSETNQQKILEVVNNLI